MGHHVGQPRLEEELVPQGLGEHRQDDHVLRPDHLLLCHPLDRLGHHLDGQPLRDAVLPKELPQPVNLYGLLLPGHQELHDLRGEGRHDGAAEEQAKDEDHDVEDALQAVGRDDICRAQGHLRHRPVQSCKVLAQTIRLTEDVTAVDTASGAEPRLAGVSGELLADEEPDAGDDVAGDKGAEEHLHDPDQQPPRVREVQAHHLNLVQEPHEPADPEELQNPGQFDDANGEVPIGRQAGVRSSNAQADVRPVDQQEADIKEEPVLQVVQGDGRLLHDQLALPAEADGEVRRDVEAPVEARHYGKAQQHAPDLDVPSQRHRRHEEIVEQEAEAGQVVGDDGPRVRVDDAPGPGRKRIREAGAWLLAPHAEQPLLGAAHDGPHDAQLPCSRLAHPRHRDHLGPDLHRGRPACGQRARGRGAVVAVALGVLHRRPLAQREGRRHDTCLRELALPLQHACRQRRLL
mmetsp:Transcript_52196/g.167268  ORF Transcript_52196/g.167268 Transcript_52196/m.167268 type:complete len:461 (-) Transcript_52196:322-1704(-)